MVTRTKNVSPSPLILLTFFVILLLLIMESVFKLPQQVLDHNDKPECVA